MTVTQDQGFAQVPGGRGWHEAPPCVLPGLDGLAGLGLQEIYATIAVEIHEPRSPGAVGSRSVDSGGWCIVRLLVPTGAACLFPAVATSLPVEGERLHATIGVRARARAVRD